MSTIEREAVQVPAIHEVADLTTSARLLPADLCHVSDVTVPAQGLDAMVVGLGRAGLGLHIPVLGSGMSQMFSNGGTGLEARPKLNTGNKETPP